MQRQTEHKTVLLAQRDWARALMSSLEQIMGPVGEVCLLDDALPEDELCARLAALAADAAWLAVFCERIPALPPDFAAREKLHFAAPVTVPMLLHYFCGDETAPPERQIAAAVQYAAEQCMDVNHVFAAYLQKDHFADRS